MAFTITWSFGSGFDGWTFVDNSDPGASATRSHVSGAIRTNLIIPAVTNTSARGVHTKEELNATITNGDTIAVDYGPSSDAVIVGIEITATYTDETTEVTSTTDANGGTLTLTLTQAKTLDKIDVQFAIGTGAGTTARNTNIDMEEVRLTTAVELTATAGKLRTPQAFIEDEGAGAAGGAGGGSGGNLASISADGLNIYIASFNNLGFPTLIRIAATLSANGTVVFDPGAGGRIGVQCGTLNNDHVWIAGQFGGTDTVEKSEDDGTSFTVKDDGTFGTIRTFDVGPSDDTRVIVFDGDNGDIIETLNDGGDWTAINAAVSPLINSIARFGQNPEEIVAGNEGDVTDSINYSPNSGVNLEDYQTGVYPNADATKVVAN